MYTHDNGFYSSDMTVQTAEDLSAAAADHATLTPGRKMRVVDFGFTTTEAVGDATTQPVISLDLRVTAGSDSGRVEKVALTLEPLAAGKQYRVLPSAFTPFFVNPGEQLVFEHKTAASGGTTTGAGHYFIHYHNCPETGINDSDVTEVTPT